MRVLLKDKQTRHDDMENVHHWCTNPENARLVKYSNGIMFYACTICGIQWEEPCDTNAEYVDRQL